MTAELRNLGLGNGPAEMPRGELQGELINSKLENSVKTSWIINQQVLGCNFWEKEYTILGSSPRLQFLGKRIYNTRVITL